MTVKQACQHLSVSKQKMARLIKNRVLAVYEDVLDKRVKLVLKRDLEDIRSRRRELNQGEG